jgi:hypothetical protein
MKNKNTFFTYTKIALVLMGLSAYSICGFAQNSAAQPQPLKKTNASPAANSNNTKAEPWQKQPIQPGKTKPAGATTPSTKAKPAEAQPIQH